MTMTMTIDDGTPDLDMGKSSRRRRRHAKGDITPRPSMLFAFILLVPTAATGPRSSITAHTHLAHAGCGR